MTNILTPRDTYRPFDYPWAYDYFTQQTIDLYWNPRQINFANDLRDYNTLSEPEKKFIERILTFFTQADVDIAGHYVNRYLPLFPKPELRKMLLAFANMESNHADAYFKLVQTLGIEDCAGFLEYPEMKEKHSYMEPDTSSDHYGDYANIGNLMRDIAVGSAFGEGLQLFGSFAMLLSFPARGKMTGLRDVVQWSLRDESLHVKGMVQIFNTLKSEFPEYWNDDTKRSIYSACRDMVELEDRFISLVYPDGIELPNLVKPDIHQYVRYLADHRLGQLGLKPNYYVKSNPLDSLMGLFTNELHEDFFNGTVTSYQHTTFDTEALW